MATSGGTRVEFGAPSPTRTKIAAAAGRRCSQPGCETILSTYNASATCWLHTQPTTRHPLHRG